MRLFPAAVLLLLLPLNILAQELGPQELFESALENNLELRTLEVEDRQADSDLKAAKAARLPSVDFETNLSWMSKPVIEAVKLRTGELGSYELPTGSVLLPAEDMVIFEGTENTHYEFKLILDQPVFTWGKIRNSIDLYSEAVEISGLKMESRNKEVKSSIYIYFYALNYILRIETALEEQLENIERMIVIAEQAFDNGFLLYTELLEVRIQKKQLEIAAAELAEQKAQALLKLAQLSGFSALETENLNFDRLREIEDVSIREREFYLRQALSNSPELSMLSHLKKINGLKIKIDRGASEFKPDIGLHLELGYSGPRFPLIEKDWYGQDNLNLTATMAFRSTVYDGGKPGIQLQRDQQELEKTLYQLEQAVETLDNLIGETVLKLELNRHNIEYFQLLQENDIQQLEMKQTLFEAGSGSETDVLEQKINLTLHIIDEYRESIEFFRNYYTVLGAAGISD